MLGTVRTVRTLRTLIILALDTTTRGGSVAVMKNEVQLALLRGDESRTHGERLPGEIERVLEMAGIRRTAIDLLAVARGPGGFTGLRIGLAAIQGLAMALDKPVVGVSALDVLARTAAKLDREFVAPWMDAGRGDVFAALYQRGHEIEPPIAAPPAEIIARWKPRLRSTPVIFVGDAIARDGDLIDDEGLGIWIPLLPDPLAPEIGIMGMEAARQGLTGPPHTLEPLYVRRPDAEIERERRGRP